MLTENAGVEEAGVSRYGKPNKKINRVAAHILNVTHSPQYTKLFINATYRCDADAARRAGPSEAAGT